MDRCGGVSTRTYDRVVRIVAWVFLLATTTIVAVTGLWSTNQAAIIALLALAGLFVLIVHDLLPADTLGSSKFVVEGSVAITVATFLVALTGGVASPFFFTFPLIVGGAALVVSPATHGLAHRGRGRWLPARGPARHARRPGRADLGRHRRDQPDRAAPAVVRRDGHRPRTAAGPRRGHPAVDHRPVDRAVQPRLLLRRARARDRPLRPFRAAGSAC